MKWLSELDDIKTPDSWIEDTLNMTSRKEDNRGRRREEKRGSVVKMHKGAGNIVKAAVVAGVLIAVVFMHIISMLQSIQCLTRHHH